MAFDFPASPTLDQDYIAGTVTYTYNGTGWVLKGTTTSNFVSKSGDTMTGPLTINTTGIAYVAKFKEVGTLNSAIVVDSVAAKNAQLQFWENGASKWSIVNTANDASNSLNFYDTPGNLRLKLFQTGQLDIPTNIASTSPTTGALTVAGGVGINGAVYVGSSVVTIGVNLNTANGLLAFNAYYSGGWKAFAAGPAFMFIPEATRLVLYSAPSVAAGATLTNTAALYINTADASVEVKSGTASTSATTGALIVSGGVGVSGALRVGNNITAYAGFRSQGNSSLTGSGIGVEIGTSTNGYVQSYNRTTLAYSPLGFFGSAFQFAADGTVTINSATSSSSSTTGALVVVGGAGVGGWLCMGGSIILPNAGILYGKTTGGTNAQMVVAGSDNNMYFGSTANWANIYVESRFQIQVDRGLAFANQTNNAGAGVGSLNNAPHAGNPDHWLKIMINGSNCSIPCWVL